jgi:predicted TIM-barrel fold metal-dependent hydrolase
VARLRKKDVAQAWAGSFDGILHKDIGGVNARLAEECKTSGSGLLVPFGSINPKLPDWQEDVRRCAKDYRMPGIRLHPNYHGYQLTDPVFLELLQTAAANGLVVQLVASMEDVRTQHPLVRVPPVDLLPLPQAIKSSPSTRLILLNWWPALRSDRLKPIADAGEVYFDIAMAEGIEGIARLVEQIPPERILFGSHFPFFYFEAALLKMQESGLPEKTKAMLFEGNARRILPSNAVKKGANPA